MISVLTLTYKRKHLLEEAIFSFINQKKLNESDEMIIINDNKDVEYIFEHPNIKIINLKKRFSSVELKFEYGYKQCNNDYIYRLDDDDLLLWNALDIVKYNIRENEGYDVYRNESHYYFLDNKFINISKNVNTGLVYKKKYLDRIIYEDKGNGEDYRITYNHNAKIFTSTKNLTMIFRWGMNTYHISGMGNKNNEKILNWTDSICKNEYGKIILNPHFKYNYYNLIDKNILLS